MSTKTDDKYVAVLMPRASTRLHALADFAASQGCDLRLVSNGVLAMVEREADPSPSHRPVAQEAPPC